MTDDKEYNRDKRKKVGLELSQKAYYTNYSWKALMKTGFQC